MDQHWLPAFGQAPPRRMRRRRFTRAEKEFAVGLLNRGWSCRRVARKLGCSSASPIRWRQAMVRARGRAGNAQQQQPQPPVVQVAPAGPVAPAPQPVAQAAAVDAGICCIV